MQLRQTPQNRVAGDYLQRARESMSPKRGRPEFAAELSEVLGAEVTANTYWSWETGRRLVPAAALVAAFRLSGLPVADPEAERTLGERLRLIEEELTAIRSTLNGTDEPHPKGRRS